MSVTRAAIATQRSGTAIKERWQRGKNKEAARHYKDGPAERPFHLDPITIEDGKGIDMWLYTVDGYYSVVENWNDSDQVMIRARVKEDLLKLADRVQRPDLASEIRDDIGTDYAYRIFVGKDIWLEYLLAAGRALNYGNFKNAALSGQHGSARSSAYHEVWSVMRRWQDRERKT